MIVRYYVQWATETSNMQRLTIRRCYGGSNLTASSVEWFILLHHTRTNTYVY